MHQLNGTRVAVVGAGVAGLCVTLELVRSGAEVTLYEAIPAMLNASAVAAGMLAPAFEAVLEHESAGHFDLFRSARDVWPEIAQEAGIASALDRSGALRVAEAGQGDALGPLMDRLDGIGAQAELLNGDEARRLSPKLAVDVDGGVFTPEDWRIETRQALDGLATRCSDQGAQLRHGRVRADPQGSLTVDNRTLETDAVIITAGIESDQLAEAAPELANLQPIKGQLISFSGARMSGPVVRGTSAYVVAQAQSVIAGATMEPGVRDLTLDVPRLEEVRAQAIRLFPELVSNVVYGRAGIRAGTADSLPLVGPSRRPGVFLASGFRRNGWLLAPLAARMIAAHLAGGDAGPYAGAFAPGRFDGGAPA